MNAMLRDLSKPIRTVLRWQLMATAALTLVAGILGWCPRRPLRGAGRRGQHLCRTGVLRCVASLGKAESAGGVLLVALGAEAVKIGLIVVLLWLVLATYQDVVVLAFIGIVHGHGADFCNGVFCARSLRTTIRFSHGRR